MTQFSHSGTRVRQGGVEIPPLGLKGTLCVPANTHSLNVAVAIALNQKGIATLLFDLLLPDEESDRANVFDIELLSQRLIDVLRSTAKDPILGQLPLGLFGASTGAAAALVAAASESRRIRAVVCDFRS